MTTITFCTGQVAEIEDLAAGSGLACSVRWLDDEDADVTLAGAGRDLDWVLAEIARDGEELSELRALVTW